MTYLRKGKDEKQVQTFADLGQDALNLVHGIEYNRKQRLLCVYVAVGVCVGVCGCGCVCVGL